MWGDTLVGHMKQNEKGEPVRNISIMPRNSISLVKNHLCANSHS
jgi:hypothetical protein